MAFSLLPKIRCQALTDLTPAFLKARGIPENDIQPAAGRNPAAGRSKSTLRSDEICALRPQTMKPRNHFGFGASFTLAAIYSRGTCRPTTIDVLMFHFRVRNGTGWDHQAMTTRLLPYFVLRTLYFVLQFVWLSSALAGCCCVCWLPVAAGGRLASAWLVLCVSCSSLTLGYI